MMFNALAERDYNLYVKTYNPFYTLVSTSCLTEYSREQETAGHLARLYFWLYPKTCYLCICSKGSAIIIYAYFILDIYLDFISTLLSYLSFIFENMASNSL